MLRVKSGAARAGAVSAPFSLVVFFAIAAARSLAAKTSAPTHELQRALNEFIPISNRW